MIKPARCNWTSILPAITLVLLSALSSACDGADTGVPGPDLSSITAFTVDPVDSEELRSRGKATFTVHFSYEEGPFAVTIDFGGAAPNITNAPAISPFETTVSLVQLEQAQTFTATAWVTLGNGVRGSSRSINYTVLPFEPLAITSLAVDASLPGSGGNVAVLTADMAWSGGVAPYTSELDLDATAPEIPSVDPWSLASSGPTSSPAHYEYLLSPRTDGYLAQHKAMLTVTDARGNSANAEALWDDPFPAP